ncbi:hypothetical protein [Streptomyces sp. NPDC005969]|uniref:hypothetical protein n=1 Tax=Streptomyces sp. NPDC005969 TaxID=3156722 RepID=UPI00340F903B
MLDVKVETENRQTHTRISTQAPSDLVHRIGGEGDRFLVVQRWPSGGRSRRHLVRPG